MPYNLAQTLKNLRIAKGCSMEEAAKQAGITHSTVSRWEQEQQQPVPDLLQTYMTELGAEEKDIWFAISTIDKPRALSYLRQALTKAESKTGTSAEERSLWTPGKGELLHAIRSRQNLTLAQVAQHLGMQPSDVSRFEKSQSAVSIEHMERLAGKGNSPSIYKVDEEEWQALTAREVIFPPREPRSCEDWEQFVEEQPWNKEQGIKLSGDVMFLRAEFDLWPLALTNKDYRHILHRVYHWHADWLYQRERYREATICTRRSLHLLEMNEGRHSRSRYHLLAEKIHFHCMYPQYKTRQALSAASAFKSLLSNYTGAKAFDALTECAMQRDIAFFMGLAGRHDEAIQWGRDACSQARHIPDEVQAHDHLKICQNVLCDVLMRAQRVSDAAELLPDRTDRRPLNRVADGLIRTEWLLRSGKEEVAQEEFQEIIALLNRHDIPHYRSKAYALDARFRMKVFPDVE